MSLMEHHEPASSSAPVDLRVRLASRHRVTLITDPSQDRFDRYGRLLAYLYVGGVNVNRAQIRRGWATTYVYDDKPLRAGERVPAGRR